MPAFRTFLFIPLFLLASGIQYDCHKYLASLPKYTLPIHPYFRSVVCPHYTAECVIYVSLATLAAPEGALINKSLLAVLFFVVCNLAVTADSTYKWTASKFGAETVSRRWRMVPLVW